MGSAMWNKLEVRLGNGTGNLNIKEARNDEQKKRCGFIARCLAKKRD